jgi:SAM-dependent methyltransferase
MADKRYETSDDELEIEQIRLGKLAETLDPHTFKVLVRAGIAPGHDVLEAGAGNGSVTVWIADKVGPTGSVLSLDIDVRFHAEVPEHAEVREFDLETDELPRESFDLIHARAVLQHLPTREDVLARLVDALRPGGHLVIEDGVFLGFAEQALEEPYRAIHAVMSAGTQEKWREPNFGLRLIDQMRRLGLVDLQADGHVWTMRPGEAGGDWWFLALERALPRLVAAGVTTEEMAAAALRQVSNPEFSMLSPVHLSALGRKPS